MQDVDFRSKKKLSYCIFFLHVKIYHSFYFATKKRKLNTKQYNENDMHANVARAVLTIIKVLFWQPW